MPTTFIDLGRRFHELTHSHADRDSEGVLLRAGKRFEWDDVLAEYRIVLLAEAGSGKTEEIRNAAQRLHSRGKPAFFLRLEHLAVDGLHGAFETGGGDAVSFEKWLQSSAEGWLLLDSIDESKLRHPGDFARAIKKIAHALGPAKERTHVILSGRTPAWRPSSDKTLCESALPFRPTTGSNSAAATLGVVPSAGFLVLALEDLSRAQVRSYVAAKGIEGPDRFLSALERDDAWPHAARPLDLDELIEFWNEHGRIGGRFELTRNSIDRRLRERDPDRGELSGLTQERAWEGAMQVAAACTLTGQSAIKIPDSDGGAVGLSIPELLPNWTEHECMSLLSRPIFDEAIYGCVRIAHRSFREYLTAQWFAQILDKAVARRRVERLFIREQYGVTVIVPSRRPILPWLAILDERTATRLLEIAPEVLLEGGDPRKLPAVAKQRLLEQCCGRLARGETTASQLPLDEIERFAEPDIADHVKRLLAVYASNNDLLAFLLRMVWRGQLRAVLPEVLDIASNSSAEQHSRVLAIRAACELGGASDRRRLRQSLLEQEQALPLPRELVSELLHGSEPSAESLEWLAGCLPRVSPPQSYSVDYLENELEEFVARMPIDLLPTFLGIADDLLGREPHEEHRYTPVCRNFAWLASATASAMVRLVVSRHEASLSNCAMMLLKRLGAISGSHERVLKTDLPNMVPAWKELNFRLFWKIVEDERESALKRGAPVPTHWWSGAIYESYVKFEPTDFERVLKHMRADHEADARVGLSLACRMYLERGRDAKDRRALWNAVAGSEVLGDDLRAFLHPRVSEQDAKIRRLNRQHNKRAKQHRDSEKRSFEKSLDYLQSHIEVLRASPLAKQGQVNQAQAYLLNRANNGANRSGHWSSGEWRSLADLFGLDVAQAFRDGAVAFWRNYRPVLRSEGATADSTPLSVVFGLHGLAIEAFEQPSWIASLSDHEAALAVRYGVHELNGFPLWLPAIFTRFPQIVCEILIGEIDFELANEGPLDQQARSYVLYDVSWSGEWIRDSIAPRLYDLVQNRDPHRAESLEQILTILQGSTVPDSALADLAREKTKRGSELSRVAHWAAVWAGVDAAHALEWVEQRLVELPLVDAREFMMIFLVDLVGARDTRLKARRSFAKPLLLKRLYLLAHQHVSTAQDIDRANSGVYSPGLRDFAQEARERLLELLIAIHGKEAFVAFNEIAEAHPNEKWRPWLRVRARGKAESDATEPEWNIAQVREFSRDQQKMPSTPRDVYEIACGRMLDLKDDLENGDASQASVLIAITRETLVRNFIASSARSQAAGRYSLVQEEELADAKRPDIRWYAAGIDAPIPMELKLADKWTGPALFERLENQLCGDYMRDLHTRFGIFLLVWRGNTRKWQLPGSAVRVGFRELVDALDARWRTIAPGFAHVDEVAVIGIDLTKRSQAPSR